MTTPEHPYGIALDQYVKNVSSASGGALTLTTIPTYSGGSDVQLLQDVSDGAVEMASVSAAVWPGQGVTSFQALQALGLINRYDLEGQVIGGPIGTEMLKGTDAIGVKGLAIHEGGFRVPVGAKAALTDAASWKGKSIRAPESSVLETGISALGADPNPLPLGDVYSALREGTVDGMEANLGLIVTQKFYEVAGFITPNERLWPFPTVLVINQAAYDGLSADQQQILVDEAAKLPGHLPGDLQRAEHLPADGLRQRHEVRDRGRRRPGRLRQGLDGGDRRALEGCPDQGLHRPDPGDQGRPAAGTRPAAAA